MGRGPEGATLAFDVFTREPDQFTVALHVRPFRVGSEEYHATVELQGTGEWQTVQLGAERFLAISDASPLVDWSLVEMLELGKPDAGWSDESVVLTRFRWVK